MKFARFRYRIEGDKEHVSWGIVKDEDIEIIKGSPYGEYTPTGEFIKDFEVRYIAPCEPTKIICAGLNYTDHAAEMGKEIPEEPVIFLKPATSLIDPGGFIVKPKRTSDLNYEAELAVIIKKQAKNIKEKDVGKYILGYTCFNDVTARDLQNIDGQWTRAKGFDTFAPVGPVVVADIDPNSLKIELQLNNEIKQSSHTSKMIFSVEKLVSFVSEIMTLNPGDVISTGTPPGVGTMKVGDVVEVFIEKIGALKNYVADEEDV